LTLPGAFPSQGEDSGKRAKGAKASVDPEANEQAKDGAKPWEAFKKPNAAELRKKLTGMQFKVTQDSFTEPAFKNAYWNHHDAGIYVDVVSGEPLFASTDKFDSGTGWPSFVKPLATDYLVYREDRSENTVRMEVRSKFGDSHLGHVFSDGPQDRGGMRYCMNSAALRFVPKAKLEKEGYGAFLPLFEKGGKSR
jgi:methionine-R-sulfoxide reductase